jgi:hypothetical protein
MVPLHPILISILFHHYKELKQCMSEVAQIGDTAKLEEKMLTEWGYCTIEPNNWHSLKSKAKMESVMK